jgi:hypothetical protein
MREENHIRRHLQSRTVIRPTSAAKFLADGANRSRTANNRAAPWRSSPRRPPRSATRSDVAARLEALAEPGEVLISGTAFDHLKAMLDYGYRFEGERKVKNIAGPVRVYSVLPDQAAGSVVGLRRPSGSLWRWQVAAVAATAVYRMRDVRSGSKCDSAPCLR